LTDGHSKGTLAQKVFDGKSFTTDPHGFIPRGNKTIRARCVEFIETLEAKHFKELPVENAKDVFSRIIDHWDHRTLTKYFGVQPHRNVKEIDVRKQYASGTVSMRRIELAQNLKEQKGYLERLGLVCFEKRGASWFLVLKNRQLTPEFVKELMKESVNDNLCITHKLTGANRFVKEKVGERSEREIIGAHTNYHWSGMEGDCTNYHWSDVVSVLRNLWSDEEFNNLIIDRIRQRWGELDVPKDDFWLHGPVPLELVLKRYKIAAKRGESS
jgi:hypothetical protein